MKEIAVSIGPVAPHGALVPRYDMESQILVAEAPIAGAWPFGVDIDGRLIFDLWNDRTLANFDLHVGIGDWTRNGALRWPSSRGSGSLLFAPETIAHKSFNVPLAVSVDPTEKIVCVEIGVKAPEAIIALSDSCLALLRADCLVGLMVRLR